MICQRPAGKARGLLWEFVGGKREAGETIRQTLIRECREELDITVEPQEEFMRLVHEYPDITIQLIVLNARIAQGSPRLLEHADLKWIYPSEIDNYAFCPADEQILQRIKQERGDLV